MKFSGAFGQLAAYLFLAMLATGLAKADPFTLGTPPQVLSPNAIEACPGCCSSHGGITNRCASNGHVICADGVVSPSCLCSTCNGTPTCTGGQIWNGTRCVCPSGQVFIGGRCTNPVQTCTGGQVWNGSSCACPTGQTLQGGVCTVVHTCTGGQTWNGTTCTCPRGQTLVGGVCVRQQAFRINPGMTGTWVSADQDLASGFGIELLPGNMLLVEWYAFGPTGGQAYVGGVGPVAGDRATIDVFQVTGPGAMFPPNFDRQFASSTRWGTVVITFEDCDNGHISWTSIVPGFGRGNMNITRLTQPVGLTCP